MPYLSTTIEIFVIFRSNNVLLLVVRMDFLGKLKSSLSSPLRNFQGQGVVEPSAIKTWTLPIANFGSEHIRLLLYRDCDRRGRKCLYDSQHVIRDKNGKFSYITTGTNGSELKNLSEYIFGCVPLSSNCGTKRFHNYDGKLMWSQVFSPKPCHQGSVSSTICSISTPSESGSSTPALQTAASSAPDEVDGCSSKSRRLGMTSLPNIAPLCTSSFEKCFSLPSKLAETNQKTLLGLGIMIDTTSTAEKTEGVGPYLQAAMSATLEECSAWFASVATHAYCNPSTFVQILYDFTTQFKSLLLSRLTSPVVSPMSLIPNWRSLPPLTSELMQLILQNDPRHCKLTQRVKLVVVGGSKRLSEVAALLYLFKIVLLQCSRSTEMDVGIDASTYCRESSPCIATPTKEPLRCFQPTNPSTASLSSSSAGISLSSTNCSLMSMSTSSPPSPPLITVQQIVFSPATPKVEEERLQKRDYDSGIELELDHGHPVSPTKSMRRSISQKFDSGFSGGSSSEERATVTASVEGRRYSRGRSLYPQHSHEFEEVSFHLGDFSIDSEQSFNTLALSEPNLDKLKTQRGASSYLELVDTKVEHLPVEPKEIKINFTDPPAKPVRPYCPYCDSIGIVTKFSPLYYIQWVKTTCCNPYLGEDTFNVMKSFQNSRFIVVNLDKSIIRTVNFDGQEFCRTTNLPPSSCMSNSSSLVTNLLHNLQQLQASDCPEGDIEQFLRVQLEFIKRIATEFGESWIQSETEEDSRCVKKKYSYLSLSENDLKLIYSLAKMKFPKLSASSN